MCGLAANLATLVYLSYRRKYNCLINITRTKFCVKYFFKIINCHVVLARKMYLKTEYLYNINLIYKKGNNMKKTLLMLAITVFFANCTFAAPCDITKPYNTKQDCQNCKQYNTPDGCEKKDCNSCKKTTNTVAQDNECFFDNQFSQMKKILCLSPQQESAINCIYDKYKNQMQILHDQAQCRQEKLCKMINDCASNSDIRAQRDELKEIRDEAKEQYKCFSKEIKAQLCSDQVKCFKKFNRMEKKKMKKLIKYCMQPHFPCDCGCKMYSACGK